MDVMCSAPQWLHHFHDQDLDGIQRIEFHKESLLIILSSNVEYFQLTPFISSYSSSDYDLHSGL